MKKYAMAALALSVAGISYASSAKVSMSEQMDSLREAEMQEVVVSAVRAQKNAPFAVSNIGRKELDQFSKTGQELPFLFARTPGVLAWSENGLGTGTCYMRIRGAADSRINITLDGVPLNSPEDQCVFWANMNSYASLLGSAQIQRGVGTSTNGDGAFGGAVNMTSRFPSTKPMLELTGSMGSYNTYNAGASFSTGLIGNHFIFDGAYHHTGTDGYMHGTDGNSGSYYGGLTWIGDEGNLIVRYKNIGNYEKTGQAWNGIDTGDLLDWNYGGMGTGIFNFNDLYKAGLGKYNSLYEYLVDGSDPSKGTQRYQMADGSLWERTTDYFHQNHNLLTVAWQIDEHWSATGTLHYTHGHGYYEEFRPNNKLSKYGIPNFTLSDGSTLKKTDFVRQKGLRQDTYGLVFSTNYKAKWVDAVAGFSAQNFEGDHFGYLTYMANQELSDAYLAGGKYTYYDSKATKSDVTAYLKGNFHVTKNFDIFGDVQYRNVRYYTNGYNDKYVDNMKQMLNIDKTYGFLNPKAGLSYHKGGHNAYASFALSHREPERNNFTDNGSYPAPSAERLLDYELGYNFQNSIWHAGVNLYYMDYVNQFVQTGLVSDIGEALTTNIKDSYRMGVEITAGVNPTKWLSIEANAALSQNKLKDFDEVVEDWDYTDGTGFIKNHYDNTTLAFSPSMILNGFVDFHHKGFQATWHTGYVSRQYLDNTECKQRSLDGFSRTDITASYTLKCFKKGLKETVFGLNFNNIFNKHYANSGWVYSAIYASGGNPEGNRYTEIGYIPSAGFTMMGNITLRF